MSSTNVSNKPRNEVTFALKFLHEERLNISYQFDRNKNAGRVSSKLSSKISPSHSNEFNVHQLSTMFLISLAADQFVFWLKPPNFPAIFPAVEDRILISAARFLTSRPRRFMFLNWWKSYQRNLFLHKKWIWGSKGWDPKVLQDSTHPRRPRGR